AGAAERTPGHRSRQHLRERGPVPGSDPADARRPAPLAPGVRGARACRARGPARCDPRGRDDAARLCEQRRRCGAFPAETPCLRARRPAVQPLRYTDTPNHAGPARELFLPALPALKPVSRAAYRALRRDPVMAGLIAAVGPARLDI